MKWTKDELYYIDQVADLVEAEAWEEVTSKLLAMDENGGDDVDILKILTAIGFLMGPEKFTITLSTFPGHRNANILALEFPKEFNILNYAMETRIGSGYLEHQCRAILVANAVQLEAKNILIKIINKAKFISKV